jgi:hypothetical protein
MNYLAPNTPIHLNSHPLKRCRQPGHVVDEIQIRSLVPGDYGLDCHSQLLRGQPAGLKQLIARRHHQDLPGVRVRFAIPLLMERMAGIEKYLR